MANAIALLIMVAAVVWPGPDASAAAAGPLRNVSSAAEPRSLHSVRFRFKADGAVRGGMLPAAGRLMFGTEAGTFYALNSSTGAPLWHIRAGAGIASVPAADGKAVYFTSWDSRLHALDLRSGRALWTRALGRNVGTANYWDYYSSSPRLVGGEIYVGSGDGHVYAVAARSGTVRWSSDAGARVRTTPAVSGNTVVVGTLAGKIVALDRRSGRPLWTFATQGAAQDFAFKGNDTRSVVTAPVIADGVVVAGGRDGNLYGIDLASGRQRWRQTHDGGSWILGLAADGDRLYSASGSALIMQGAELATGKEIWRSATGNAMFGGIAQSGEVLVSNGMKGTLFGFDARAGHELWRFRLPDLSFATPAIGDGAVFTAADDGSVYAIDTRAAAAPEFDKLVYAFANQLPDGFFWFTRETRDSIVGGFTAAGFKPAGDRELLEALRGAGTTGERTILVIADTRLPDGADGADLRRFVDGGGTLVLLGVNPLSYSFDAKTGAPETVDDDKGTTPFGMTALQRERDYGYNVSHFTAAAAKFGLIDNFVSGAPISPDQVSLVLARDRLGMATAWAKRFRNGGLLINLPVPRNRPFDVSAYVNAVGLMAAETAAGSNQPAK